MGHGEHIDSQAALQANKATFFFQLVSRPYPPYVMPAQPEILTVTQERELEKVNTFYLQKEAEVSCILPYQDGFQMKV